MDRRIAIKNLLIAGVAGITSMSIFEYYNFSSIINFNVLNQRKNLIAELAETIIPRTDTPGAKDAGVEDFILTSLKFCTGPREQHLFLNGLNDLEKYTVSNYGHQFAEVSKSNKIAILEHFEDKSTYAMNILNKIDQKYFGKPFFIKLKELTIEGYCNSQLGATKGLAYDYVPSKFEACIPLVKNQRSWATK